MERIRRHTDKPITDDWKDVVEEILTQEVPKRAQAVPVTFFVRFGRQADNVVAANGDTDCACFADEEVCVCYGPCPPDICDDIPVIKKA